MTPHLSHCFTLPAAPTLEGMTNALSLHGVTKRFKALTAVDAVSLTIPRGQIVALLGANGAGKTTLLDIALGLQVADEGSAALFDMEPREAIRRSLVGVVHQTGALLEDYTVKQMLTLFAATHPQALPVAQILEETHLTSHAHQPIVKLSGGERQRVRLALALLPDPQLLILDEPTSGMDAMARRAFWDLMRAQSLAGRTIIFATHYLAEAQDFAERTIIMDGGRVVADAATADIQRLAAYSTLSIAFDLPSLPVDEVEAALHALPGSAEWQVDWGAERLIIQGADLDDAARYLLSVPGAHGLEIVPSSLEDAYAAITNGEADAAFLLGEDAPASSRISAPAHSASSSATKGL